MKRKVTKFDLFSKDFDSMDIRYRARFQKSLVSMIKKWSQFPSKIIALMIVSFSVLIGLFVTTVSALELGVYKTNKEILLETSIIENFDNQQEEDSSHFDYDSMTRVGLTIRQKEIFNSLAKTYTEMYDLPEYLPYFFASIESDFTVAAKSHKNAIGLFQVTNVCLKEYNNYHSKKYVMSDLYDMETNFIVSMWYIDRLINHYKIPFSETDPFQVYSAYNMGPSNHKRGNTIHNSTTYDRYVLIAEEINVSYKPPEVP